MYKPPQQQRSRESLERILDAAESLIRERGFEAMTIAEVVERSGSSVGSLYARFRNKRGLLQAVQGRYVDRVETALAAAMAGSTDDRLEDCVNRVVGHLCDYLLNDPKLFRHSSWRPCSTRVIRGQGEKISGARRDMVTEALLQHRPRSGIPILF
jgi:AcrR family transcriptional regulator